MGTEEKKFRVLNHVTGTWSLRLCVVQGSALYAFERSITYEMNPGKVVGWLGIHVSDGTLVRMSGLRGKLVDWTTEGSH